MWSFNGKSNIFTYGIYNFIRKPHFFKNNVKVICLSNIPILTQAQLDKFTPEYKEHIIVVTTCYKDEKKTIYDPYIMSLKQTGNELFHFTPSFLLRVNDIYDQQNKGLVTEASLEEFDEAEQTNLILQNNNEIMKQMNNFGHYHSYKKYRAALEIIFRIEGVKGGKLRHYGVKNNTIRKKRKKRTKKRAL
jgi:hypothetical protein